MFSLEGRDDDMMGRGHAQPAFPNAIFKVCSLHKSIGSNFQVGKWRSKSGELVSVAIFCSLCVTLSIGVWSYWTGNQKSPPPHLFLLKQPWSSPPFYKPFLPHNVNENVELFTSFGREELSPYIIFLS